MDIVTYHILSYYTNIYLYMDIYIYKHTHIYRRRHRHKRTYIYVDFSICIQKGNGRFTHARIANIVCTCIQRRDVEPQCAQEQSNTYMPTYNIILRRPRRTFFDSICIYLCMYICMCVHIYICLYVSMCTRNARLYVNM